MNFHSLEVRGWKFFYGFANSFDALLYSSTFTHSLFTFKWNGLMLDFSRELRAIRKVIRKILKEKN